jgi:hypothetical protein
MTSTKENLKEVVRDKIGTHKFLVVSNREPYIHTYCDNGIRCMTPASGMTVEWRSDADIKFLLEDLKTRKNLDFPERPRISLGIDDIFYPSLAYYLKRGASAWLEVDTVRPYASDDFYYLEDAFDSTRRLLPTVDPHQDILPVRKSSNKT